MGKLATARFSLTEDPDFANLSAARQALTRLARDDINAFAAAVMRDEMTGAVLENAPLHEVWHDLAELNDRLLIWSAVEHGKAVPLDTPIPTPAGWTTMGALRVGESVFARDGRPCVVTFATPPQHGRQVFRVRFDDGGEALADAEHLWIAKRCWHGRVSPWRVVSTAEMRACLRQGGFHVWRIPLAEPAQFPEALLPVHPYVLGAWLGDGDSAQPVLTFSEKDRAIYERCIALEGGDCLPRVDPRTGVWRGNVGGFRDRTRNKEPERLRERLRRLGVLGAKHIPTAYLAGSVEQRMELLRGLLDTDGSVSGRNPRVEFTSTSEVLALGVLELVRSLGFKATLLRGRARLGGRDVGPKFRVCFTAGTRPVFWLPRKLALLRPASRVGRATYRSVVAIEEVASVPVRCIRVDSLDSSYLMGRDYTVTHNTTQMSVIRPLWSLGRDPSLRIAIVSNTVTQATKIMRPIKAYIERSAELKAVFPNLKASSQLWTNSAIIVERPFVSKDPSIQALGVHGNITGARVDLLILDDILDFENTRTSQGREDLWSWYHSALAGRLTERARVLCVGTAYHPDDFMHRFAKMVGPERAKRFPVMDPQSGTPRWPERWPAHRIEKKRQELTPIEFARQLLCVARDDNEARFKKEWLDRCLLKGAGKSLCYGMQSLPPGFKTYTGVDLAVQQKDGSDSTVLFTIAVHPNGDREVLNLEAGKWSGPEIVSRIIDTHKRYLSLCVVENNAAQDFIVQFARGAFAVPIRAFTTGRNKAHPEFGVESIAAEMAGGKWIIPSNNGFPAHPEIQNWIQEMLYYQPSSHTGDRLMASWFAREGARLGAIRVEGGNLNVLSR